MLNAGGDDVPLAGVGLERGGNDGIVVGRAAALALGPNAARCGQSTVYLEGPPVGFAGVLGW